MISPVSSSAAVSQAQMAQVAAPALQQQASLKPDTVSISPQGHAAASVSHDGDNDGH